MLKTLPKMARKADLPELREAFEHHREETEGQIANLEKVFELIGMRPRGVTCQAIEGILEEGKEIMEEATDPDTRDAGMIAAAQAVEHYEITRYGTHDRLGEPARHEGGGAAAAGQPRPGIRGGPEAVRSSPKPGSTRKPPPDQAGRSRTSAALR